MDFGWISYWRNFELIVEIYYSQAVSRASNQNSKAPPRKNNTIPLPSASMTAQSVYRKDASKPAPKG